MRTPARPALRDLAAAVAREARLCALLAETLRAARRSAEAGDPRELERAVASARDLARDLARQEGSCARARRHAALSSGLTGDPPLAEVAARAGDGTLRAETARLAEALELLAVEAGALGVCVRFGAAVTGHLISLCGAQPVYGPGFGPGTAGAPPGRRA